MHRGNIRERFDTTLADTTVATSDDVHFAGQVELLMDGVSIGERKLGES